MTANQFMELPPIEWEKTADGMTADERLAICEELEARSKAAGMTAAYLAERYGYGCGDQGHKQALKKANRAGRMIWVRVFGYNGFLDLNV